MSGVPSKSETGYRACPKVRRKPSISKVILRVMADKGEHSRVSLNTLKNALIATGYNMTRNAWRLKKTLKGLVDKGMLKQVTGRGTLGSFRMGKKFASKFKPKAKRQQKKQQHQPGQRRSGQRRSGRRRSGQHRLSLSSKQGHKRLIKGARRVAKCRRN